MVAASAIFGRVTQSICSALVHTVRRLVDTEGQTVGEWTGLSKDRNQES